MEETEQTYEKKPTIINREIKLEEIMQVDSHKKFNLHFFNLKKLLFTAGRSFQILDLDSLEITKVLSNSPGGVGSVAIHPNKKIFAVAEKGAQPQIFVYSFPELERLATLPGGTEKAFKHIEFSASGNKLASLGCAPDYSLALWDWENEILNLKAKAFSQEVVRVSFSKFSEKILVTSGLTHIKFWNVANTFTGLKLKGYIGKFGVVKMTDISGFEIFPDEKVLSGSETGELLLWESHFVKAILHERGFDRCHRGNVEVVQFLGSSLIMTAGQDDYLKFWSFEEIDDVEPEEDLKSEISLKKSIKLFSGAHVISVNSEFFESKGIIFVKCSNGQLLKILFKDYMVIMSQFHDEVLKKNFINIVEVRFQLQTNSGKTRAFDNYEIEQPINPLNVGIFGSDSGIVKLMDLSQRRTFAQFNLENRINCLLFFPKWKTLLLGFESGLLKSFHLELGDLPKFKNPSKLDLMKFFSLKSKTLRASKNLTENLEHNGHHLKGIQMFKIFSSGISHMIANAQRDCLVLRSHENELFVMRLFKNANDLHISPSFLLQTESKIRDFKFHNEGTRIMFALEEGKVVSVKVPDESEIDNQRNYLIDLSDPRLETRATTLSMMQFQKPQLDENDLFFVLNGSSGEENVEWEPEPVSVILEVSKKSPLILLGKIIQAQMREAEEIQSEIPSEEKEKTDSAEKEGGQDKASKKIEGIKVNQSFDFESLENLDLVLASSEGNFLGFLYLIQIDKQKVNKKKSIENDSPENFEKNPNQRLGNDKNHSIPENLSLSKSQVPANASPESEIVRPLMAFEIKKLKLSKLKRVKNSSETIFGYENGCFEIRNFPRLDVPLIETYGHDQQLGTILHACFFNGDEQFLSIGGDCTINFYTTNSQSLNSEEAGLMKMYNEKMIDTDEKNYLEDNFQKNVQSVKRLPDFAVFESVFIEQKKRKIVNLISEGYSLQEEKIQAVEDKRVREEEIKRKMIHSKISDLKNKFGLLKQKNLDLPEVYRLSPDQLVFDEAFLNRLYQQKQDLLKESEKELEYEFHLEFVKTSKLKQFFLDELHGLPFSIRGIKSPDLCVKSFKVKKASKYMREKNPKAEVIQAGDLIQYNRIVSKDEFCLEPFFEKLGELDHFVFEYAQESLMEAEGEQFKSKGQLRLFLDQYLIQMKRANELSNRLKDLEDKYESDDVTNKKDRQKTWEEYIEGLRNRVRFGKREDYYEEMRKKVRQECTAMSIEQLRRFQQATKRKVKELRDNGQDLDGQRQGSADSQVEVLQAEKMVGDYKLKIKMDFELTDEMKISMESQESRIIHLESLMLRLKILFNQNLRNLRRRKRKLVEKSQEEKEKLRVQVERCPERVQALIGEWELPMLKIEEAIEYPHKRWIRSGDQKDDLEDQASAQKARKIIRFPKKKKGRLQFEAVKGKTKKPKSHTSVLKERIFVEGILLKKKRVEKEIQTEILDIEERLRKLKEEKALLEDYFRRGEIRVVGLFQEMLEIEIFERKDLELQKEYFDKRKNYMIWENEMNSIYKNISKNKRLEGEIMKQLREISDKLQDKLFPEDDEKYEIVYDIFREKRDKEIDQNGEGDLITETLSDMEDHERKDWYGLLEQNEEALELAKNRYESEQRLKKLMEEKKNLVIDRQKVEKKINNSLQNVRETVTEIGDLFKQKLKRVFKLYSSLIVKTSQIYARMPIKRLNQTVLFSQKNRRQLDKERGRLEEDYKVRLHQNYQLDKSMDWLNKEMFVLEDSLKRSQEELEKNFQLKFGERIDLSILDSLKETSKMRELRKEYKAEERASVARIREAQNGLTQCRRELMALKRKNTEIIQRLTRLGQIQLKLNKILDSTNKQIFKDEQGTEKENLARFQTDHRLLIELHKKKLGELQKEVQELELKGNMPILRKILSPKEKGMAFKLTQLKKNPKLKTISGVKLPKITKSKKSLKSNKDKQ